MRFVQALTLVIGLGLLLAAWFVGGPGPIRGFPLDDAWIHMVYGRQLVEDGFLAYNPGVPATGATSPLWALIIGGLHWLIGSNSPDRLVLATYLLGALLHLSTLWAALRLARACGVSLLGACAAALCLAAAPLLALSAFSGMEVPLCALLLLVGHERLLRRSWVLAGVILGLACTTRPEAAACLGSALPIIIQAGTKAHERAATQGHRPAVVGGRRRALLHFAAAPVLFGVALLGYNLWASNRPLPATYYLKQATSLTDLPGRAWIIVARLLPEMSPFAGGWIWLGLLGFVLPVIVRPRHERRPQLKGATAPLVVLLAGLAFIVGNVLIIPPSDPAAYYHQRYVLPATPLLIVGLIGGYDRLRFGTKPWQQLLPVTGCACAALLLGLGSMHRTSRHFHSDIRNINQLQRALGEWLAAHTDGSAWLATVDAGAVRYFSHRPAVDLMGLNTPELYWDAPAYAANHPVQVIALMPAWFPEIRGTNMRILHEVQTVPYTVTSHVAMGRQLALGCGGDGSHPTSLVELAGVRRLLLYCVSSTAPLAPGL